MTNDAKSPRAVNESGLAHGDRWETKEMLIWGETFPELSNKYTETVCTGAVALDGPGLIRLYPLALRYLEGDRLKKWDVVTAQVSRNPADSRPESWRILDTTIERVRHLGTGDGWGERMQHMLRAEHMVEGLEHMEALQADSRRSLGVVKPAEILGASLDLISDEQLDEHRAKYDQIIARRELWPAGTRPVPALRYKPRLKFRCPGDSKAYNRRVLDWEVCELARRFCDHADPSRAFEDALMKMLCNERCDPHLIFGNISNYPHTFVVVSILYPPKTRQPSLFF